MRCKNNIIWAESDLGRSVTSNAWMISKWGIENYFKGSDCSIIWVTVTFDCKELMESTEILSQAGACPSPDLNRSRIQEKLDIHWAKGISVIIAVFLDVTPCSLINRYQRIGGTLVYIYQSTWRHVTKDGNLDVHYRENLKFHRIMNNENIFCKAKRPTITYSIRLCIYWQEMGEITNNLGLDSRFPARSWMLLEWDC
jgi:hypothetical protein